MVSRLGPLCGVVLVLGVAALAPAADEAPAPEELAEWLDRQFVVVWEQQGRPSPELIDDSTFLRRVYLDLVGSIPSVSEARDFLNDTDPEKRVRLIDQLASDRRYAAHLARVWRRVLVPPGSQGAAFAEQLEPWLQEQFKENVGYNALTRSLITASLDGNAMPAPVGVVPVRNSSPAAFAQAVGGKPDEMASSVTRVFLGVRIGCAQCHDHPFADWKQKDFWGMAAFFSGMNGGGDATTITSTDGKPYSASFLDGKSPEFPEGKAPREVLAEWMTSAENANFTATAANRVWQHLCGKGLVSPVDDLDLATPEERALVLDELGARFAAAGFDVKWLIRGICRSKFYQSTSVIAGEGGDADLAFRRPLKTLTPEQVFDSLEQALMLPIARGDGSPRYNGQRAALVGRLAEGMGASPEEYKNGIPQVLMLMNGKLTADATGLDDSRTLRAVIEAPFLKPEEKIETLYLAAFTRKPRPQESEFLLSHVSARASEGKLKVAYSEIFWALLNSPEFVLSR